MSDKKRLLIVDDDELLAESMVDIFLDEGYATSVVNSGNDAIEHVRNEATDIVLMDVKMPGMNGVEAFREIKKIRPETRIIMMTGFSLEGLIKQALNEGAFGVVFKPFDVHKLIEMVGKAA